MITYGWSILNRASSNAFKQAALLKDVIVILIDISISVKVYGFDSEHKNRNHHEFEWIHFYVTFVTCHVTLSMCQNVTVSMIRPILILLLRQWLKLFIYARYYSQIENWQKELVYSQSDYCSLIDQWGHRWMQYGTFSHQKMTDFVQFSVIKYVIKLC